MYQGSCVFDVEECGDEETLVESKDLEKDFEGKPITYCGLEF